MGSPGFVSLRLLGDVPLRRRWFFIWDLFETSWTRTDGTSLLHPLEISTRRSNKTSWRRIAGTSWRRFIKKFLGVSFETSLGRSKRRRYDVATTSCCWGEYQKPMLRQIEWWVQNGPITKIRVLPVTTLSFKKFCFGLRTSYKELIWCTNDPMPIFVLFCKRLSFLWRCFFPVSILKSLSFPLSFNPI